MHVVRCGAQPRLVQAYVEDPFLVHVLGGMRKTDLRLYAVVTSFDPLRVFLHPVGQVKVAQKAYSSDYTDMFAHISNKVGSAEVCMADGLCCLSG
jgi:hypothetical protein